MEEILLKEEVELELFDNNSDSKKYLLSYRGRHWKVSSFVSYVINVMQETKSLDKTYKMVFEEHSNVSYANVENVYKFLLGNGLLVGTEDVYNKDNKNKNLWGKINIIPSKLVNKMKFLNFMFYNKVMILLGFFEIVMVVHLFTRYDIESIISDIWSLNLYQLVINILLIILLGLVHEFGHSIALISYGQSAGNIGMGVYLYMPVFYSNVTNAWKLNRMQRFCVDIGGMYFQTFAISVIYMMIEIINKNLFIKPAIVLSALQIFGNFNPFIKMDGYWMICDWFGITNPYKIIIYKFKNLFNGRRTKTEFDELKKRYKVIFSFYAVLIIVYFTYLIKLIVKMFVNASLQMAEDIQMIDTLSMKDISFYGVLSFLQTRIMLYLVVIFTLRGLYLLIKKLVLCRRSHECNSGI